MKYLVEIRTTEIETYVVDADSMERAVELAVQPFPFNHRERVDGQGTSSETVAIAKPYREA